MFYEKIYNTLGDLFWTPAGSRWAPGGGGGTHICETYFLYEELNQVSSSSFDSIQCWEKHI